VVYDACVLYPAALRDLLLRLAVAGLCRARWTEEILEEVFESLTRDRPDLDPYRLSITRRRMCEAVHECLVTDYHRFVPDLELPDPGDRHVLAAAIACDAESIVTNNLKHFPEKSLEPYGVVALSADEFVMSLIGMAPDIVAGALRKQAAALKHPPCSEEMLLAKLDRQGLKRSSQALLALGLGR
jgi:hypothetical protein